MWQFLDGIRIAGDEVINGLFWVDAGMLVRFLLGGLAIILHIIWGLLVYSSPLWIPGIIIYLFATRKERAAKRQRKQDERQRDQESAAARVALEEATSARIVKDLVGMNVNSMPDLALLMEQNQLQLKITPYALSIIGRGKALYQLNYKQDFDFEFANANVPDDKVMRGKVLKFAQSLQRRMGDRVKLNEHPTYKDDLHQVQVGTTTREGEDAYGRPILISEPIYEMQGSIWVTDYYITIAPPAPAPAPAPAKPSTTRVI
ncbi:MAG: hypothetical protein IJC70_03040 [Firmicutes bacterium]|nr:hypothetical protein [Bacillota bacterium]